MLEHKNDTPDQFSTIYSTNYSISPPDTENRTPNAIHVNSFSVENEPDVETDHLHHLSGFSFLMTDASGSQPGPMHDIMTMLISLSMVTFLTWGFVYCFFIAEVLGVRY